MVGISPYDFVFVVGQVTVVQAESNDTLDPAGSFERRNINPA